MALNITSGKVERAQKVVIYGPEGIGKTCLAASFPNPLFIDVEGGSSAYDVRRIEPAPSSWSMLMEYVGELRAEGPAICSTVVIDTADWAERLCMEHVLDKHGATGIEDFGWGKGYTYVKEEFARFLDALSDIVERGVNVVVCAHAQIKKFEQPDELGTYDRWELKLDKRDAPLLKEWADMLLFCNYETIIVKPDQKTGGHAKAAGGKRVIYTSHTPAWDAKNRVGLAEKLPLEFAAIAEHIPSPAALEAPKAPPAANAPMKLDFVEVTDEEAADSTAESEAVGSLSADAPAHLKKLYDLMAKDGVTEAQLQSHCGSAGYCTSDTPVAAYPADFAAYLVSEWPKVKADIESIPFDI